jgi:iron donor protein CyaY
MAERITSDEFQRRAEETIARLESAFSKLADERDIDVQVQEGVLTITFEEGEPGKFIVSPNSSALQIWVSARVSSSKFDWSTEKETFELVGTGETIREAMQRLTREQLADDEVVLG